MEKITAVILVGAIYVLLLIIAGIYAAKKTKKASDFLVAGRRINLPMTVATLAAVWLNIFSL